MNPDRAAVGSALLLVASAPPSPLALLVFVALVPLVGAVDRLPSGAEGRRRAFRAGAIYGAVYWGVILLWIPQVALRVGVWAAFGYLAVVSTLSLLAGLSVLVLHRLRRAGVVLPLAVAVAWIGVEWLRTAWLGPLSFPWMGLALPLSGVPPLIQGAAWVGEIGVAFGVAAVNGFVAASLRVPGARPVRAGVLILLGLVIVFVGGRNRINGTDTEPVLRALLVQPDVSLADKRADPSLALRVSIEAVDRLLSAPEPEEFGPVDVVILPETAIPTVLDGPDVSAVRESVASWSRRLGAPLLVGAYAAGVGRGGNAVFLASDDPGANWPSAWKTRLVPGVEWVPWAADAIQSGAGAALLELPGSVPIAPLICIESAGPQPARDLVARGARVLVNVTNDAWLGERPWWSRSAAFAQHPAHLSFRAVEGGVGALRVGNNGRTESVDPFGRRSLVVPPFEPGLGRAEIVSLRRATPFISWGPWVGTLCAVLALASVLVPPHRPQPLVDPPLTL